jgi:GNAT superfamily N-acetyltransferase
MSIRLIFILLTLSLNATESGSWTDVDKENNPVIYEWYAYSECDEDMQERLVSVIPVYARAKAPLRAALIAAFHQLPPEEQEKSLEYRNYPSDFTLENCHEFLEATLLAELQAELTNTTRFSTESANYLVLAKNPQGNLLGFIHFSLPAGEKDAELEPIMIDPEAQGKGLARALIFSILLLRPDVNRIHLMTSAMNHKAHAVYRHLGFKEVFRVVEDDLPWDYGTSLIFEYVAENHSSRI